MFGFGKGKVIITLEKYQYTAGETIKGTATLKLKKPVEAKELTIRLLGEKKTKKVSVSSKGAKSSSKTVAFYDFSYPLDGEKTYVNEKELSYPFEIKIPKNLFDKKEMNPTMERVMNVMSMFAGGKSQIKWHIIANLDVPWKIDVSEKVQITIN
jgi:hypothetical protein